MGAFAALLAGLVFGFGLVVSGMSEPLNVIAFLRLAEGWNPALIFVMASALAVTALGYRLVGARAKPLFDGAFSLPTASAIDRPLVGGAALFGVGWGLSGFCPGPAIVSATQLDERGLLFVGAYIIGAYGFEGYTRWRAASATQTDG